MIFLNSLNLIYIMHTEDIKNDIMNISLKYFFVKYIKLNRVFFKYLTFLVCFDIALCKSFTITFNVCEAERASCIHKLKLMFFMHLILLHSKRPKLYGVLAFLSAIGLRFIKIKLGKYYCM